MERRRFASRLATFALVQGLLAACANQGTPPQPTPFASRESIAVTRTSTAAPETEEAIPMTAEVDCAVGVTVRAWIDADGDGVHDADEAPLEGAEIAMYTQFDDIPADTTQTAHDGIGTLYEFQPGRCLGESVRVEAHPPESYEATTESSLQVPSDDWDAVYEFGFRPLAGAASPTPRLARYECAPYHIPEGPDILEVGSDGTLWAIGFTGQLYRFDQAADTWTAVGDNPGDGAIWLDLQFGADGLVWAPSYDSALRYDGEYVLYQGEAVVQAVGIPASGQSADGTLWFRGASDSAVVSYRPSDDTWRVFAEGERTSFVRLWTNGSIWLLEMPIRHPSPQPADDGDDWTMVEHQFNADESFSIEMVGRFADLVVSPDGTVWIADSWNVIRFNPQTEQLTWYPVYEWEIQQFGEVIDLAAAPDGSIWVGSGVRLAIVIQIVPLSAGSDEADWYVYDSRDGIVDLRQVFSMAAVPDGSIWLTGWTLGGSSSTTVYRCQPVAP